MASSASLPPLNAVCTSSTTISQLDASVDSVDPPPLLFSVVSSPAAASSLSFFLAAYSHPFRCSARIPEGPP